VRRLFFGGVDRRRDVGNSIHLSMNRTLGQMNGGSVMLVLSRKSFESVVVGDAAGQLEQMLKVTVLSIVGGRVRLGFEAAEDIRVHRWEVWQRARDKRIGEQAALAPRVAVV